MSLELVPLCNLEVHLRDPIFVGDGPAGTRLIFEVESATVEGDRVRGKVLGHGNADWLTINGTVGTLDVRLTIETDDGALIFVQYQGRVDVSGGAGAAPIYCAPVFETGDDRYAWLNVVQAVGQGSLDGSLLNYEWFEVRAAV
jgi:hypothetical protein